MQRSARITEANTTAPGPRSCRLGWPHRSCIHNVFAFSCLRFSQRLFRSFEKTKLPLHLFWRLWRFLDCSLLSKLCFTPWSCQDQQQSFSRYWCMDVLLQLHAIIPTGPQKTCLWSLTVRVLSSTFSFVPLIVPNNYFVLGLTTRTAAASTVQMSTGMASLSVMYPNLTSLAGWQKHHSIVQWDFIPFTFHELC